MSTGEQYFLIFSGIFVVVAIAKFIGAILGGPIPERTDEGLSDSSGGSDGGAD